MLAALFEKWLECKANGADQPFFLTDQSNAKKYIDLLASEILGVLVQEKELFNNFVHDQLNNLRIENKRIQTTLDVLEELIRKNELTKKSNKKIFRPIPDSRLPIVADSNERKALLAVLLKVSLYKTFSQTKYHKFNCLMTYSRDAFCVGEDDMAGLTLYTGEIDFLSNLTNLVDIFMKDTKLFIKKIERYYDDPLFLKFKLQMGIICHEGLYAYEFEIDGSAKRFSVLQTEVINEIDYDNMYSLNSTLRMIPIMTIPSMMIVEFDKIKESSSMTKFIYSCLLEDKVDLGKIRINVDDFDDWDFEYRLNSKNRTE